MKKENNQEFYVEQMHVHYPLPLFYIEVDIVEKHYAFFRLLAQSGNFENLIARLAFGSEDNTRILA